MSINRPTLSFFIVVSLIIYSSTSYAANKKHEAPAPIKYRVALINSGAYAALYNQALNDLSAYSEINIIAGDDLKKYLAQFETAPEGLIHAVTFGDVSKIKGLDFALILAASPLAYPAGHVAIKSINWRTKNIHTEPAIKVPIQTYNWLALANNGWVLIMSDPASAHLTIDGVDVGFAPVFMMPDKETIAVVATWKKGVVTKREVAVATEPNALIQAPPEYLAKQNKRTFYKRMQDADEKYGAAVYIGLYVTVMIASLALLFYNPVTAK